MFFTFTSKNLIGGGTVSFSFVFSAPGGRFAN
jgi:hypothetical protein